MERIVFCPTDGDIESARALARQWCLPIQVGQSERTNGMTLNGVSVISVPEEIYVDYFSPVAENQIWTFIFVDDFSGFDEVEAELLECDNEMYIKRRIGMMKPSVRESHKITFSHRFTKEGLYVLRLLRNGDELCKNEIEVHKDTRRQMR